MKKRDLFNGLFKYTSLILATVAMTACTNSQETTKSNPEKNLPEHIVEISKLQEGDFLVLPDNLELGSTEKGELSRKVVIKNTGSSETPAALALSLAVEGHPSIAFKTNRCGATLAKGKSCEVVVAFKQRGLYNGLYSGSLQINSATLPISATVINNPDPDTTGTPELELTMIGTFDTFKDDKIPYRSINVKNIGTGTATDLSFDLPVDYSIRINRCPSTLKVGHSCTIQVLLNQARQKASAPLGNVSALLDGTASGSLGIADPPHPTYNPQALVLKVAGSDTQSIVVNVSSGHVVDLGDGTIVSSPPYEHTYADNSDYIIQITNSSGNLVRSTSNASIISTNNRLKEVVQWGTLVYPSDMSSFFRQHNNFTNISAVDTPNFSNVTNMRYMFSHASSFNSPLNFNTSSVTNMSGMFTYASSFNQSLNFNTSSVTDMSWMFTYASSFNSPLNFNTSSVIYMSGMFSYASSFNQDLSGWCVSNILSKPSNFDTGTSAWVKAGRQPIWGTCPIP